MHYIAILYEKAFRSRITALDKINLRGYNPATWVPAEFSTIQLPVSAIAFALCPTARDLYLEKVLGRQRKATWGRYQGRVIDELYKLIHERCEDYCRNSHSSNFDLYGSILSMSDTLPKEAKQQHSGALREIVPQPTGAQIQSFDDGLKKLLRFEAELTSAFINFEIARLQSANPHSVFSEYFNFNTNMPLRARHQGFTSPATPDFIYRHEIVGDIKSGKWQRFFEHTVIAYALAYEEHTGGNMDLGAILHVGFPENRLVPAHYDTDIIVLNDLKRNRFIAMRNRKLEIVGNRVDLGVPENKAECDPDCPFLSFCWGGANE